MIEIYLNPDPQAGLDALDAAAEPSLDHLREVDNLVKERSCTSEGIGRRGVGSLCLVGDSFASALRPVVLCPHSCTSERSRAFGLSYVKLFVYFVICVYPPKNPSRGLGEKLAVVDLVSGDAGAIDPEGHHSPFRTFGKGEDDRDQGLEGFAWSLRMCCLLLQAGYFCLEPLVLVAISFSIHLDAEKQNLASTIAALFCLSRFLPLTRR